MTTLPVTLDERLGVAWTKIARRVGTTLLGVAAYLGAQQVPWAGWVLTTTAVAAGVVVGHASAAVTRWHCNPEGEVPFGDAFVRVVTWFVLPVAALLIAVREPFLGVVAVAAVGQAAAGIAMTAFRGGIRHHDLASNQGLMFVSTRAATTIASFVVFAAVGMVHVDRFEVLAAVAGGLVLAAVGSGVGWLNDAAEAWGRGARAAVLGGQAVAVLAAAAVSPVVALVVAAVVGQASAGTVRDLLAPVRAWLRQEGGWLR
jgi:hypothetical protein